MNPTINIPFSCRELKWIFYSLPAIAIVYGYIEQNVLALVTGLVFGSLLWVTLGTIYLIVHGSPIKFRCRCDDK